MITCRHLDPQTQALPSRTRPLARDFRDRIGAADWQRLSRWTGFSIDALERLAAGEEVRVSARMWGALASLAACVNHDGDFFASASGEAA